MSTHTPGPWVIDWNVSRLDVFSADAFTLIACLRRSSLSPGIDETSKANARLIAAAPELLEACRRARMAMGAHAGANANFQREYELLDEAISKAAGEKA